MDKHSMKADEAQGFVVAVLPYGPDPQINHGLPELSYPRIDYDTQREPGITRALSDAESRVGVADGLNSSYSNATREVVAREVVAREGERTPEARLFLGETLPGLERRGTYTKRAIPEDPEIIKEATRVLNAYNYRRKQGEVFTAPELEVVRASRRIMRAHERHKKVAAELTHS